MALRDAGWIQLYVESNQEAVDTIIQAYRIAERCELPVMVCMDGFFLTHTFEPVALPEQKRVDSFLPPFHFSRILDPSRPLTLGGGSEADNYLEYRQRQHQAMVSAAAEIENSNADYADLFGRDHGGLIETYRLDNAEVVMLSLGSVMGAIKDAVDGLREQGKQAGALRLRCFRPFPVAALLEALAGVGRIIVLEKAFSAGAEGIVATELSAALHQAGVSVPVESVIAGLGGRDVTVDVIENIFLEARPDVSGRSRFVGQTSEAKSESLQSEEQP